MRKSTSKCLLGCVALTLAMVVAGCGSSNNGQSSSTAGSSKSYAELRWGQAPFPGALDYQKTPWAQVADVESLAVQNLVEFQSNGTLKPGLASSIEHPNSTTYVYNIRSGVKFSDGHLLTVADVVYSLDQNLAKESALKSYWADVASVNARGSSAVVVKLKQPSAVWPQVLAFTGKIYEKAAAETAGEKALGTPGHMLIGTGPWKIDSFTPEVSVQLSRNPYWSGPPQPAAKISISMFKSESTEALALRSGAIDGVSIEAPKSLANVPGARLLVGPHVEIWYLIMNTTQAPFSDLHVRRAIAYATNVQGMINAAFPAGDASEAVTLAPPALFAGFNSSQVSKVFETLPKYGYDLTAAKRELAKSAYPHGFTTEIQVLAFETLALQASEVLSSDLAKIGIEAKIHEIQTSEASDLYGSKVKLMLEGITSPYPDPYGAVSVMLPESEISSTGGNRASYRNAELNKLLTAQEAAASPTRRLELIGELLKIAGSEEPYKPLYATGWLASLSNKYVFPSYSAWTFLNTPWAMEVKQAG
ncbi:MAG TPA: ABC transporter substrate-binding protein [Solirubrobacteraceae bacterium]|nr:ABC transporter substrate-binding protein [Solirubrobacteraceae bacterium]